MKIKKVAARIQEFDFTTKAFAGSPDGAPIKVKKGESIRLIMKNPTGMSHPFHLHGHYFRGLGRPRELNLVNPPLKDTVTVPAQDEVVVQFDTDNPGKWFYHCHIE